MTTLTMTDAVTGSTIDASLTNNNNTALKAVVNGGIDNTNVNAAAAIAASKLGQSGATTGQVLAWNGSAWAPADTVLPWLIDINVFPTAIAQTNWDSIDMPASTVLGRKVSSGAQNAEINWDVVLAAGTWTVELVHYKETSNGIYTVQVDGVTAGTVDGYNGASSPNQRGSVTGITVAATGKKRLKLLMATKNGSSTNYFGLIQHVQLRRTA